MSTLYPHGDPVMTRPGPVPVKPAVENASQAEVKALLEENQEKQQENEATDGQ
jgi:hypothetical protein